MTNQPKPKTEVMWMEYSRQSGWLPMAYKTSPYWGDQYQKLALVPYSEYKRLKALDKKQKPKRMKGMEK